MCVLLRTLTSLLVRQDGCLSESHLRLSVSCLSFDSNAINTYFKQSIGHLTHNVPRQGSLGEYSFPLSIMFCWFFELTSTYECAFRLLVLLQTWKLSIFHVGVVLPSYHPILTVIRLRNPMRVCLSLGS